MSAGISSLLSLSLTSPNSTGQRRAVGKGRECRIEVEGNVQEPHWKREEKAGLAGWEKL